MYRFRNNLLGNLRAQASFAVATVTLLSLMIAAFLFNPTVGAVAQTSLGAFDVDTLFTAQDSPNTTAITANSCDSSQTTSTYAKTIINGVLDSSLSRNGSADWFPPICNQTGFAVGHDGTAYIFQVQNNAGNYNRRLAAYKHGVLQGTPQTVDLCPGSPAGVQPAETLYPTEGANNTIYFLAGGNTGSNCPSPQPKLVAFDGLTGLTKYSVPLLGNGGGQGQQFAHIFPWTGGVAVLDGSAIRYFDLKGVEDIAHRQPVDSTRVIEARGTSDGRVYVRLSAATATTNGCASDSEIVYTNPDGTHGAIVTDNCAFQTGFMATTPDNGLLLQGGAVGGLGRYDGRLVRYSATGTIVYNIDTTQLTDYSNIVNGQPKVDGNGNVLLLTTGHSNLTNDNDVILSLYNATGVRTQLSSTAPQGTAGTYDNFRTGKNYSIALAPQHAYITTCHFDAPYFNNCSTSSDVQLADVPAASVTYEYPASSLYAPPVPKVQYAALGDGYASGESLAPYLAPSDTNGCHRSAQSYAQLLGADTTLNLSSPNFVACSGATTSTVINGGASEPQSQLTALQAPTDLVTITAGSDDVAYLASARICMLATNCLQSSQSSATAYGIAFSLPGKLDRLYQAIKAAPGVTAKSRVLVVGYPALVANPETPTPGCTGFSRAERYAVAWAGAGLNQVLRDAVTRAGAPFEYVDASATANGAPFLGHEPCGPSSYFVDPAAPSATALYPTQAGQAAYAQLVKSYLAAHPATH